MLDRKDSYNADSLRSAFALINAVLYVPSFFIEDYALGLGVETNMAFYVLSILNAMTTVCRVLPNWLGDR